ncbi:hypothetical protein B5F53_15230 [Blautia sp. An249]|uniref:hypothetical protein n=1 Tax=Blautia sp. An249 TaxID=1965603 RepID=UPI000B3A3750|nr:hypothetical protein [Blautia sp. An249]OUO76929.1 hypothetical protein B5F53_15230 [Blautia sp. An249]
MKDRMNLRLFEDGAGAGTAGGQGGNAGTGNGSQGGNAGGNQATFSFEQAEEIANARAHRAEQAALKSYFQQQGMTQEQVQQALNDYRERQKNSQPNTAKLQQERDDALEEVAKMKNEKILSAKGVKAEDLDYVMFKVSKMVDDKTDFKKAAEKFLKENPRFAGQPYRVVSTGTQTGGGTGKENDNDSINAAIRRAAGR